MKVSVKTKRFLNYEIGERDEDILKARRNSRRSHESVHREIMKVEQAHRDDLAFYGDAKHYLSDSNFVFSFPRAQVLAKHYFKFSPRGEQPLISRHEELMEHPGYIGKIFNRMVKGVEERLAA